MCQAYEAEARFVAWIERDAREAHSRGEHATKPEPKWCYICRADLWWGNAEEEEEGGRDGSE